MMSFPQFYGIKREKMEKGRGGGKEDTGDFLYLPVSSLEGHLLSGVGLTSPSALSQQNVCSSFHGSAGHWPASLLLKFAQVIQMTVLPPTPRPLLPP